MIEKAKNEVASFFAEHQMSSGSIREEDLDMIADDMAWRKSLQQAHKKQQNTAN